MMQPRIGLFTFIPTLSSYQLNLSILCDINIETFCYMIISTIMKC